MRMGTELFQHLGTIWGWGQPKFWGFIGANPQKTPNFGDGDGVTCVKIIGDSQGTGIHQILGIFGKNSQKSPNFGVGTGETISGIFTTLVLIVILHFRKGINRKIQLFACKKVDEKNPKNFAKPKNDSKVTKTLKAGTSQF